jgi:hypothetical protein
MTWGERRAVAESLLVPAVCSSAPLPETRHNSGTSSWQANPLLVFAWLCTMRYSLFVTVRGRLACVWRVFYHVCACPQRAMMARLNGGHQDALQDREAVHSCMPTWCGVLRSERAMCGLVFAACCYWREAAFQLPFAQPCCVL